jgi:O-antigen/teichoic acid export membrane protein
LIAAFAMTFWHGNKLIFFVGTVFVLNVPLHLFTIWLTLNRYRSARPSVRLVTREATWSMLRYGSLAFLGSAGMLLRRNGIAVVMNVVFGNVAAAAMGIAVRLGNLIMQLINVVNPVMQPAIVAKSGAG